MSAESPLPGVPLDFGVPLDPGVPVEVIAERAEALHPEAVAFRRDLHRHPERAWTEFRTTAKLAGRLREMGLEIRLGEEVIKKEVQDGLPPGETLAEAYETARRDGLPEDLLAPQRGGCTGVMGVLETGRPGPTVGMRFDIDANMGEESAAPEHLPAREGFASARPGLMRNCAHDGHATVGLFTAAILAGLRDSLSGRVKFIFQPAEEGIRGAEPMTAAGLVDDVDFFLAPHIGISALRTGKVVCGTDGFAAKTSIEARFRGRIAHTGLEPEKVGNATLGVATTIERIHALADPLNPSRVMCGYISAGNPKGTVADRAEMFIAVRGATNAENGRLREETLEIIHEAAERHGLGVETEIVGRCVSAESDEELARVVAAAAAATGDFDEIVPYGPFGAAEDATYMMERVQSRGGKASYLLLGTELPEGHHRPRFDFNEGLLLTGPKLFAAAACRLLAGGGDRVIK